MRRKITIDRRKLTKVFFFSSSPGYVIPMCYNYQLMCILKSPKTYIEETIPSSSFTSALFTLVREKKIDSSVFLVYCRRTKGDLQLMGSYDGLTVICFRGMRFTHILRTTEDKDYAYYPDGFRRVYIR